jgi:hypothetical protein
VQEIYLSQDCISAAPDSGTLADGTDIYHLTPATENAAHSSYYAPGS